MTEHQLDCALDLMRRLPPQKTETTLANLIDLVPDLCEDLLSAVDQPLKVAIDPDSQRPYLLCEYNRDGDSYRSPWSNKYDPPTDEGVTPSPELRALEIQANDAFDTYREMYFEGGISSVYFWDKEEEKGFAGVILVKKEVAAGQHGSGCWDSVHVIDVTEVANDKGRSVSTVYKLTSTVMLWMETHKEATGEMTLGGNMTRQQEMTTTAVGDKQHIGQIGQMVEDAEIKMRGTLNDIYFGKTKDIVNDLRSIEKLSDKAKQRAFQEEIARKLEQRGISM